MFTQSIRNWTKAQLVEPYTDKGENWTQNLASIYKKNIVFWL